MLGVTGKRCVLQKQQQQHVFQGRYVRVGVRIRVRHERQRRDGTKSFLSRLLRWQPENRRHSSQVQSQGK